MSWIDDILEKTKEDIGRPTRDEFRNSIRELILAFVHLGYSWEEMDALFPTIIALRNMSGFTPLLMLWYKQIRDEEREVTVN